MLHDTPNIGSRKFFEATTEIVKVFKDKFKDHNFSTLKYLNDNWVIE